MLSKIYTALGLTLCLGLGVAFAAGWRAPHLGWFDGGSSGSSHSSGGRSSYHFSSWHFGK